MLELFYTTMAAVNVAAAIAVAPPPSCSVENRPAMMIYGDSPESVAGLTGTSIIRVELSPEGELLRTAVVRSAGISVLDRAAVSTAKAMRFAPEIRSCKKIPGSYAVEVDFTD